MVWYRIRALISFNPNWRNICKIIFWSKWSKKYGKHAQLIHPGIKQKYFQKKQIYSQNLFISTNTIHPCSYDSTVKWSEWRWEERGFSFRRVENIVIHRGLTVESISHRLVVSVAISLSIVSFPEYFCTIEIKAAIEKGCWNRKNSKTVIDMIIPRRICCFLWHAWKAFRFSTSVPFRAIFQIGL